MSGSPIPPEGHCNLLCPLVIRDTPLRDTSLQDEGGGYFFPHLDGLGTVGQKVQGPVADGCVQTAG